MTEKNQFSIAVAKRIISAKLNNQAVILRRYERGKNVDITKELFQINNSKNKIAESETVNEIMGYEGIAAKYYFQSLSKLIVPDFSFTGRNRMPPKDPFNSMLSLGYTILMSDLFHRYHDIFLKMITFVYINFQLKARSKSGEAILLNRKR